MKEDRFRSMFAAFGTLTDCSLKFTKDGKFRKFGFVGFKSEEDANKALKHFNKSFVDTSRVTVWPQPHTVCASRGNTRMLDGLPVLYSRWSCVKRLETPVRQEPGVNTLRAQGRANPLLRPTLMAKR